MHLGENHQFLNEIHMIKATLAMGWPSKSENNFNVSGSFFGLGILSCHFTLDCLSGHYDPSFSLEFEKKLTDELSPTPHVPREGKRVFTHVFRLFSTLPGLSTVGSRMFPMQNLDILDSGRQENLGGKPVLPFVQSLDQWVVENAF